GPMGSGKTTLAHRLARSVGCPAICRDEIKEGMVHTTSGFVARPGDELTMRTLPVFFSVLELLLRAGVTTVAEAAFQDPGCRRGRGGGACAGLRRAPHRALRGTRRRGVPAEPTPAGGEPAAAGACGP